MGRKIFEVTIDGVTYYYLREVEVKDVSKLKYIDKSLYLTGICPKCSGNGLIERYMQFHSGVCYDCNGRGTRYTKLDSAKRRTTLENRIKKEEAREIEEEKQREIKYSKAVEKLVEKLGEESYIVLNGPKVNTYKERDNIKNANGVFEPESKVWVVNNITNLNKGLIFVKIHTRDFINCWGTLYSGIFFNAKCENDYINYKEENCTMEERLKRITDILKVSVENKDK